MEDSIYPKMIKWPLNEQARYIRGFVDGEGGPRFYIYRGIKRSHHTPGDPHIRAVVMSNSDKCLLNTIQQMLMKFGIKSRMYIDKRKGERKATKDCWVLRIQDRNSLVLYFKKIGFSDPKKMDILQQILASYRKRRESA